MTRQKGKNGLQQKELLCKEWCPPEGACQNPGLLWDVGHSALDPHVTTMLLHLAQECCQQGTLTCTSRNTFNAKQKGGGGNTGCYSIKMNTNQFWSTGNLSKQMMNC